MSSMTTLSQVLNILRNEGYTTDFNLRDNCLICHGNALEVRPEDFVVDRHYRFEGDTDPGDSAIVYAISSPVHGVKGVLVNGYGLYSDPLSNEMVKALDDKASKSDQSHVHPQTSTPVKATINLEEAMAKLNSDLSKDVHTMILDKLEGCTMVLVRMNPGGELKSHTAPGPISVHVLQGAISFRTADEQREVAAGELTTLAAKIPHSVFAYERTFFLITIAK